MKAPGFPEFRPLAAPTEWTGLEGASVGMALAHAAKSLPGKLLVVVPREEDVERLCLDAQFFAGLLGLYPRPLICPYPARPGDLDVSQMNESTISWQRLGAQRNLIEHAGPVWVIASPKAIAQRTLPKSVLVAATDLLEPGLEIDRDDWVRRLIAAGYQRDSIVEEPGSFSVRGSIVDLFPPGAALPIRVELMGDRIESIRTFDLDSQRSLKKLDEATWTAAREIIFDSEEAPNIRVRLKELADHRDLPPSARLAFEEALDDGRYVPAMDSLLPIFYEQTGTLFDLLPRESAVIQIDPFSFARELDQLRSDFERVGLDLTSRSILAFTPEELSIPLDEVRDQIERRTVLKLADVALSTPEASSTVFAMTMHTDLRRDLIAFRKSKAPLAALRKAHDEWRSSGLSVLITVESTDEAKRVQGLLAHEIPDLSPLREPAPSALEEAKGRTVLVHGNPSAGFRFDEGKLVVVAAHDLFGERKHAISSQVDRTDLFASIAELASGDYVVHLDFGIGKFRGLERLTVAGIQNDFLHLEYAEGTKLYLPVYRLNRIQKYLGSESSPQLDRLGNASSWEKTKTRAQKAVAEMAQELIQLYAARRVASRDSYGRPDESYLGFEADFAYEETRDQLRAIEDVSRDIESDRPMDRLICGDVGFGKTEVALRAAFRVAMSGRQVAVLVPTTILCQQHYETFKKRIENYPMRVEFLSRFKSPAEQKAVLADLAEGKLDMVIGTHRLLSKDVTFRNLGLLVIDEEHRFGVKHKERIKQFRNKVDVLTLTATPIPRTLQMSMAGIRDLSVINTPPLDRKSIQTYLCKFDDAVIKGAIKKELARGGQVFFVHNKVQNIFEMGAYIQKLVPEAKIVVGHGQMSEDQLEEAMLKFIRHEADVLLCTTIIESGLDISSANTILVNRADTFGLAQLYQLRGRVGRSEREAFAYLLIPGEELISRDSLRRLKVLKRFTDLGSGFKIALHDLEIRGAGNLLGPSQSGQVAAVGLELYTQLLEREVRRMKGEAVEEEIEPEIQCHLPAFLPEDFVPHTGERLLIYKRLSGLRSDEELEAFRNELLDRFGPLPVTAENLLRIISLKIVARRCSVSALRLTGLKPSIELSDKAGIHLDRLLALIKKDKRIALRPDQKLVIELPDDDDRLEAVRSILERIVPAPPPAK